MKTQNHPALDSFSARISSLVLLPPGLLASSFHGHTKFAHTAEVSTCFILRLGCLAHLTLFMVTPLPFCMSLLKGFNIFSVAL